MDIFKSSAQSLIKFNELEAISKHYGLNKGLITQRIGKIKKKFMEFLKNLR